MQTFTSPTRFTYFSQQKNTHTLYVIIFQNQPLHFHRLKIKKKKVCLNISFLQSEFTFLSTKCKYYSCFYCLLVRKSPTCQTDLPWISKLFTLASQKLAERKLKKCALLIMFSSNLVQTLVSIFQWCPHATIKISSAQTFMRNLKKFFLVVLHSIFKQG